MFVDSPQRPMLRLHNIRHMRNITNRILMAFKADQPITASPLLHGTIFVNGRA